MEYIFLMADPQGGSPWPTFIFMGAIFLIIWLFMIRPQAKKIKEQKNFIENLQKGDKIVTSGGIHGRVLSVHDNNLLIEIDKDVKIKLDKSAISLDLTRDVNKEPAKK